jgi:hypothetical protein
MSLLDRCGGARGGRDSNRVVRTRRRRAARSGRIRDRRPDVEACRNGLALLAANFGVAARPFRRRAKALRRDRGWRSCARHQSSSRLLARRCRRASPSYRRCWRPLGRLPSPVRVGAALRAAHRSPACPRSGTMLIVPAHAAEQTGCPRRVSVAGPPGPPGLSGRTAVNVGCGVVRDHGSNPLSFGPLPSRFGRPPLSGPSPLLRPCRGLRGMPCGSARSVPRAW